MIVILINALTILFQLLVYPIVAIFKLVKIFASNSESGIKKFLKIVFEFFKITLWFCIFMFFLVNMSQQESMRVISGTVTIFSQDGTLENYHSNDGSLYHNPTSGGNFEHNGVEYNIDLGSLPSSLNLPSGTYQTGSVLQRAQLLLIVQEICARPEIHVTPEQLLGVYYAECTASISCSGDLTKTAWPAVNNKYNCGGPFQIMDSEMNNSGCAFISSIEDPNRADSERVLSRSKCGNLPAIGGQSRPSKFVFSDAAYTAALLLSWHYPASTCTQQSHWTIDASNYAKNNGLSTYGIDALEFNSALAYYNGYVATPKSWLPAFYGDVIKINNRLDVWSNLSVSRSNLNNKLKKELIPNTIRTLPNMAEGYTYYDSYAIALAGGSWESAQYPFVTHNGGKWVYEGLCALGAKVGSETTQDTLDTNSSNNSIGNYTKIKDISWSEANKLFPRYDQGGPGIMHCIDVATGKEFTLKRIVGTNHADCETATAKDTEVFKSLFGNWGWNMRAILIKGKNGTLYAASVAGMPHAGKDTVPFSGSNLDYVKGNNMNGVVDVHFRGSKTHVDSDAGITVAKEDSRHQTQIDKAIKATTYLNQSSKSNAGSTNNGLKISNGYALPVSCSYYISSNYGDTVNRNGKHTGTDIAIPVGTALYACKGGKVIHASYQVPNNPKVGGGLYVTIQHSDDSLCDVYMHMSKCDVKVGDIVKQGQRIGESGNTGSSTGPHLHFQINKSSSDYSYSNTIDPTFVFK